MRWTSRKLPPSQNCTKFFFLFSPIHQQYSISHVCRKTPRNSGIDKSDLAKKLRYVSDFVILAHWYMMHDALFSSWIFCRDSIREVAKIWQNASGIKNNRHTINIRAQQLLFKTLPKAQRTRGLSSYHKITVHKSGAYYNFRISIKHLLQNLNQTSASPLNLNLTSWPNLASPGSHPSNLLNGS